MIHNTKKHAGCREIPAHQREKKVLATVRNPYDLFVSQYEFGWWKRREFLPALRAVPNFEKDYPSFPNISFADYVKLSDAAFEKLEPDSNSQTWGLRTREFINFYFRDPADACSRFKQNGQYVANGAYRKDMFDLHFVRTDDLNRGLYEFLVEFGYEDDDVSFILEQGKVLPQGKGRNSNQQWQKYYTPELKQHVRERERLLFTLFPEFDV